MVSAPICTKGVSIQYKYHPLFFGEQFVLPHWIFCSHLEARGSTDTRGAPPKVIDPLYQVWPIIAPQKITVKTPKIFAEPLESDFSFLSSSMSLCGFHIRVSEQDCSVLAQIYGSPSALNECLD